MVDAQEARLNMIVNRGKVAFVLSGTIVMVLGVLGVAQSPGASFALFAVAALGAAGFWFRKLNTIRAVAFLLHIMATPSYLVLLGQISRSSLPVPDTFYPWLFIPSGLVLFASNLQSESRHPVAWILGGLCILEAFLMSVALLALADLGGQLALVKSIIFISAPALSASLILWQSVASDDEMPTVA